MRWMWATRARAFCTAGATRGGQSGRSVRMVRTIRRSLQQRDMTVEWQQLEKQDAWDSLKLFQHCVRLEDDGHGGRATDELLLCGRNERGR
jgi:hypothetical protein